MPEQTPEKKIIIDEDWKTQAEAEKQKLAEQAEQQAGPTGSAAGGPEQLPPANFAALVSSLVTQALFALGGMEDPHTGQRFRDLALAKHYIDLLVVLEEKTRGNVNEAEKKLLDTALYECRMEYVRLAQLG